MNEIKKYIRQNRLKSAATFMVIYIFTWLFMPGQGVNSYNLAYSTTDSIIQYGIWNFILNWFQLWKIDLVGFYTGYGLTIQNFRLNPLHPEANNIYFALYSFFAFILACALLGLTINTLYTQKRIVSWLLAFAIILYVGSGIFNLIWDEIYLPFSCFEKPKIGALCFYESSIVPGGMPSFYKLK